MDSFAYYLSASAEVAQITKKMWKVSPWRMGLLKRCQLTTNQNIDWCYIFYALQNQIAAILLSTSPRWYLYQALGSNLLWVLPWAIVVTETKLNEEDAWTYYSVIFGGSLVFSFFDVVIVSLIWGWRLTKGKITFRRVHGDI